MPGHEPDHNERTDIVRLTASKNTDARLLNGKGRCLRSIGLRKKAFLLMCLESGQGGISRTYLQAPDRVTIRMNF